MSAIVLPQNYNNPYFEDIGDLDDWPYELSELPLPVELYTDKRLKKIDFFVISFLNNFLDFDESGRVELDKLARMLEVTPAKVLKSFHRLKKLGYFDFVIKKNIIKIIHAFNN